jgi:hypothetical protein
MDSESQTEEQEIDLKRPLSNCTTEEIMEELELRFDSFVMIAHKRKVFDDEEADVSYRYHGNFTMAIGYCERLKYALLNQNDQNDY